MSNLIKLLAETQTAARYARELQGRLLGGQRGIVVDVDDPLNLGRVKVVLDSREDSEKGVAYSSNWYTTLGSFTGRQPASLVGQRVSVVFTDGNPSLGVIADILFDQTSTKPASASTMVRLPLYKVGELPPASELNRGCVALIMDDVYGDYQVVCLKRQGQYLWERTAALTHIHAGQQSGFQGPDSDGNSQQPVDQSTRKVYDDVTPTTHAPQFGGLPGAS